MRIVLAGGHPTTTREVRTVLTGRYPIDGAEDLAGAIDLAARSPESVVVAVWPATPLGARRTESILGESVRVPVIAVLDAAHLEDRMALTACGAAYLPLPLHGPELVHRLQELEKGASGGRRWMSDLCVDALGRTVHRRGTPIDLPRKEFDLLAHFVAHPRTVLEREALLEAVWGSTDYNPNVVEVAVSSLRRKLEAHGPRLIHTVRGVGYVCREAEDRPSDPLVGLMARRRRVMADRAQLIAQREQLLANIREARLGSVEVR
jgi:two-component system, OmpR family, response regulator MprA